LNGCLVDSITRRESCANIARRCDTSNWSQTIPVKASALIFMVRIVHKWQAIGDYHPRESPPPTACALCIADVPAPQLERIYAWTLDTKSLSRGLLGPGTCSRCGKIDSGMLYLAVRYQKGVSAICDEGTSRSKALRVSMCDVPVWCKGCHDTIGGIVTKPIQLLALRLDTRLMSNCYARNFTTNEHSRESHCPCPRDRKQE
jgi:hypothetical protein